MSEFQLIGFSFYKCEGDHCNVKYAVESEAVEEPVCPACGSYYFSHITDIKIEI
ncbi:MAG TPA: hypothetical protein IAA29_07810 [Candidatus Paenibacillus intestinavium]|nr:hypothetical protein [Candidatus Paenibacillus intestinavium]